MNLIAETEDFWFLLHNLAHWEFELFLMFIFDVVLGLALIPLGKKWLRAHDTRKHAHEHCDEVHQDVIIGCGGQKPFNWADEV